MSVLPVISAPRGADEPPFDDAYAYGRETDVGRRFLIVRRGNPWSILRWNASEWVVVEYPGYHRSARMVRCGFAMTRRGALHTMRRRAAA